METRLYVRIAGNVKGTTRNMDVAWIGVVGTLVGGILVGVIAHFSKNAELKILASNERLKNRLAKLEELHSLMNESAFRRTALADAVFRMHKLRPQYSMREEFEIFQVEFSEIRRTITRAATLQRIYSPDLSSQFRRIINFTNELEVCATSVMAGVKEWDDVTRVVADCDNAVEDFLNDLEKLILSEIS